MNWLQWFNNAPLVGFYALGLVAIIASLRVVVLANPVHAILSLIVSLLALSGIFFILGAPFAGALQVIVYAGAILVLFVFVIMMLNLGIKNDERENKWLSGEVWAVPTGLTLIIAVVLYSMIALGHGESEAYSSTTTLPMIAAQTVTAKSVGITLFSKYVMLVEVAAMLLLAALVAAYHLGKKALDDENVSHSQLNSKNDESNELTKPTSKQVYEPIDANYLYKNFKTNQTSDMSSGNQEQKNLNGFNKGEG